MENCCLLLLSTMRIAIVIGSGDDGGCWRGAVSDQCCRCLSIDNMPCEKYLKLVIQISKMVSQTCQFCQVGQQCDIYGGPPTVPTGFAIAVDKDQGCWISTWLTHCSPRWYMAVAYSLYNERIFYCFFLSIISLSVIFHYNQCIYQIRHDLFFCPSFLMHSVGSIMN